MPDPLTSATCETCCYWRSKNSHISGEGECRRHAPIAEIQSWKDADAEYTTVRAVFPVMHSTGFCGDHNPASGREGG